jgi:hypothetical protein
MPLYPDLGVLQRGQAQTFCCLLRKSNTRHARTTHKAQHVWATVTAWWMFKKVSLQAPNS